MRMKECSQYFCLLFRVILVSARCARCFWLCRRNFFDSVVISFGRQHGSHLARQFEVIHEFRAHSWCISMPNYEKSTRMMKLTSYFYCGRAIRFKCQQFAALSHALVIIKMNDFWSKWALEWGRDGKRKKWRAEKRWSEEKMNENWVREQDAG